MSRTLFRNALAVVASFVACGLCVGLLLAAPGVVAVARGQINSVAHPYTSKHLYSDTADPKADIAAALKQARREHKRVILDFGGDWCGDCQVLDIYLHQEPNLSLLEKHFVLVHVWIGHQDHNLDIAAKYGAQPTQGVPTLAVLGPSGNVLYTPAPHDFSRMRYMDSSSVTDFLNRWKN